ncbi:MAG: PQQ-binding-like beta-propeller repeat protein [Bacteroidota bacterium]
MKPIQLMVISALCISGNEICSAQTGWNNGGGNSGRNGYSAAAGPLSDSVLWQVNTSGFFGSPLFIEGDKLVTMRFRSLTDAPVECRNLYNGTLLWSTEVTGSTGRSLHVGIRDQKVFVVRYTESMNDSLFALDANTGSRIWTANVTVAPYITTTAVFDSAGYLYIEGNQKMYKIDPQTGQMIWQTPSLPMASGSGEMAIVNSTYKGYTLENIGGVSYVWSIDLNTGAKLYNCAVPDLQSGGNVPQSALMAGMNGIIYTQLTEDNIAALSDDGIQLTLMWQTKIRGNCPFSLMCMGTNGSVYAPSNGKVFRLDGMTGTILDSSMTITQGGFYIMRASASDNGLVYVTNGEDFAYAFDQNLVLVWSDQVPFTNTSGICIAPNGLAATAGDNLIKVYGSSNTTNIPKAELAAFSVYPNPATTFVKITTASELNGIELKISDVTGRVVHLEKLSGTSSTVDISALPAGTYWMNLDGGYTDRILVKD